MGTLRILCLLAGVTALSLADPLPLECHDMYKYWNDEIKECDHCDFGPCDPNNPNYSDLCQAECPGYWDELKRIEREGIAYHEKIEKEKRNCHDMYKYYDEKTSQCEPCDFGPCDHSRDEYTTQCPQYCPDYWEELKRIEEEGVKYHEIHKNDPPISKPHNERTREMLKVVLSMIAVLVAMAAGIFGIYVVYVHWVQRTAWCQRRAPPTWIHRYECQHERTRAEGREPDDRVPKGVEAKEEGGDSVSDFPIHQFPNAKQPLIV